MGILQMVYKLFLTLVVGMMFFSSESAFAKDKLAQFTEQLNPEQTKQFVEITEEQFCPCGMPQSFKETLLNSSDCESAQQLARFLVTKVKENVSKRRVVRALLARVATISSRVDIQTKGDIPRMGDENAPIQIVVFSDFQCPFCSRIGAPLKDLVKQNKDVSMIYKFYPLPMHKEAKNAAKAACAAQLQGKFWPMHDALFAAQKELTSGDFDAMAKTAKLNLKKYKKDLLSVACVEAVEADIKEGDAIQLQGTPSIYVNGLLVDNLDDLPRAIEEARLFESSP